MPFAIILAGILALVLGYNGTEGNFFSLLKSDFTGPGNFIYWILAIAVIGGLGYVPGLQGVSRAFLFLVILVLVLTKGQGFFSQFNGAINGTTNTTMSGAGGMMNAVGAPPPLMLPSPSPVGAT